MSKTREIDQEKLKVRFVKPEGKISRRELLKLVMPRYEVIPFVESALCQGSRECGLCLDTCPLAAIKSDNDAVIIDTALCSGCGACVEVCPYRAIAYPTFSLEHLDKEMEKLLTAKGAPVKPGIVAFVCQSCESAASGNSGNKEAAPAYPAGVLLLTVPCLAMVSPWLMLRAFDRGASGLALIFNREKCSVGLAADKWQGSVQFVQALLKCWGIEPERIRVFNIDDGSANLARQLDRFAKEIAGLPPLPLWLSAPASVPTKDWPLPSLIRGLRSKLGVSGGVVTDGAVPFGKLALDKSRCIGCGLCVRDCPTEALAALSEETGNYRLLFRHDLCLACGKCITVCPEKCLKLERSLELEKMDSPAVVLFEDKIARCRECGAFIGPRAMVDGLQSKLGAMGASLASLMELCPDCKMKAQFSPGRDAREPKRVGSG
ncbi:MAG: 4Fe-4S binding protein [Chloroflexi bacterium]|nr:4Fe-4S binding protein [Chloroflexota bacterium]